RQILVWHGCCFGRHIPPGNSDAGGRFCSQTNDARVTVMPKSANRIHSSPSARIRNNLGYPVIDTDVHTSDYTPHIEDHVAEYGGATLVDALRKAHSSRLDRGGVSAGKSWYEQTPEERQYHRTIRSPWWARVTRNTLDVA